MEGEPKTQPQLNPASPVEHFPTLPSPSLSQPPKNDGLGLWDKLFENNHRYTRLHKVEVEYNEEGILVVPEHIIAIGEAIWSQYLVGYFTDTRLYYFKFSLEEERSKVLAHGSCFIVGKAFVIKQWTSEVEKEMGMVVYTPLKSALQVFVVVLTREQIFANPINKLLSTASYGTLTM